MTEHKLVLTKYMRSIASVLMADPKVKSLSLFFTDNTQGDWRAELLVPIQGQDCLGVVHMSGKHLDASNEDTPEHLLNLDAALLGTHISRITMVRSTIMEDGALVGKATDRNGQIAWLSTMRDPATKTAGRNPLRRTETKVAVVTKPELKAILDDKRVPKAKAARTPVDYDEKPLVKKSDVDRVYESGGLPGLKNAYPDHITTDRLVTLEMMYPELTGAPDIHIVTPYSMDERSVWRSAYVSTGGRDIPPEFLEYDSRNKKAARLRMTVARMDYTPGVTQKVLDTVRGHAKELAATMLTVLLARNDMDNKIEDFHAVWDRGHGKTAHMAAADENGVTILGSHQLNGMHMGVGPTRVSFDLLEARGTKEGDGYHLYLSFVANVNGGLVGGNARTDMVRRLGRYVIYDGRNPGQPGTIAEPAPDDSGGEHF